MDCLFCKIAAGEIPSTKVYEDDTLFAFQDIAPQAKVHILVIPKEHAASGADEINGENSKIIANIFEKAAIIAKNAGLDKTGYRIVTNVGQDGGQTVRHLHFHILGGNALGAMV